MAYGRNNRPYKKRRRQRYRHIPLTIALMLVALLFGINVFLKIKTIEVEGAERYTPDEILAAAGTQEGDSLMLLDSDLVAANIQKALPYIDRVDVSKQWPSTLVLTVRESRPAAVIEREGGGYYKLNKNGRILEEISQISDSSEIRIIGLIAAESNVGGAYKIAPEDELRSNYVLRTMAALYDAGREENVGWIDVTDAGNITFSYANLTIELGSGENIDNKLAVAFRIMEDVGENRTGRITVKNDSSGRFIPAH